MERGKWALQGRHCHHVGTGRARGLGWIIAAIGVAMRGASASLNCGESLGVGGKEHGGKESRGDWTVSNAGAPTSPYAGINTELGEGWTECVHEGPTSCQNHMEKGGGGFSFFDHQFSSFRKVHGDE